MRWRSAAWRGWEICRRLLDAAHPEAVAARNGVARSAPTAQVGPSHQEAAELYARILGP
jgi:hypothetical protein